MAKSNLQRIQVFQEWLAEFKKGKVPVKLVEREQPHVKIKG